MRQESDFHRAFWLFLGWARLSPHNHLHSCGKVSVRETFICVLKLCNIIPLFSCLVLLFHFIKRAVMVPNDICIYCILGCFKTAFQNTALLVGLSAQFMSSVFHSIIRQFTENGIQSGKVTSLLAAAPFSHCAKKGGIR